ncbi:amidohydrolase [Enterovirga rhinocerotis]|uniref:Aminobenzoyl-glutamate utilization protein B n=1 Tax=Enterovirga rhinocerotis TaxID=1339210 RepID=A0A4R7C6N6_9HYPH|nr:amidohydrolase [Enterovirga rhinocerotis]TDR94058.1 aminobenzoyl-glutamate utilization protein B [Enterovirga rhinocerotis]
MRQNDEPIWNHVDAKRETFVALSDRIWGMPELNYAEHRSAEEHRKTLEAEGFRVTTGLAGIPTAVMGEAGDEGPVIAILGEYDALPGLSQEAGVAEHRPVEAGGPGHGCGHNLLGSAAMLAATAVKDWLAAHGVKGRVRYYGCPAEEGGSAKAFMARDGIFSDVDVAISWHPAHFSGVGKAKSLAMTIIDFAFAGRAAHAAAAPHLGRSALDAVELMNVGVNYMREHMPDGARIHYAVLDSGGIAANVVQAHAKVRYIVRAADIGQLKALAERVRKVADGAALMTETRVETTVIAGMSNLLGNRPLERTMHENLMRLGPPDFDAEDRALAAQFQATLAPEDISSAFEAQGLPVEAGQPLCDAVLPLERGGIGGIGSTDVGDVSWVVPTVQAWGATLAIGTPFHSWQFTGQGKAAAAHKGLVHVAKVMAGTAVDLLRDEDLRTAVAAEFAERRGPNGYECPIPPEVAPALDMSRAG